MTRKPFPPRSKLSAPAASETLDATGTTPPPLQPTPVWHVRPEDITESIRTAQPEEHAATFATTDRRARLLLRRRALLLGGFWAGLGVLAMGGLATTLDFFNPRDVKGFGGLLTIPAANVPRPGADPIHFLEGKVWLVNLKPGEGVPEEFRSFAPASEQGGLLALYHKCVHLGCTVPWRPDFAFGGVTGWFRCPCHGSTYTKGGVRVFGPATRSLDTFQITAVTAQGVTIDTGKITLGAADDPQQKAGRAVPPGPFA
jgi:cytochrome b6-f complex iron-sulfur subunit